jgi:hypothetical protein
VAVPDFQSLMLPRLRIAGDGKEHALAEARIRVQGDAGRAGRALAQRTPVSLRQPSRSGKGVLGTGGAPAVAAVTS